MNGRDGDFDVSRGAHVTRVFDIIADGRDAFATLCAGAGVDAVRYNALATCSCRWSRGAINREAARTRAFYHVSANRA